MAKTDPNLRIDVDAWTLHGATTDDTSTQFERMANFDANNHTRILGLSLVLHRFAAEFSQRAKKAFDSIGIFPSSKERIISHALDQTYVVQLDDGEPATAMERAHSVMQRASAKTFEALQTTVLSDTHALVDDIRSILREITTPQDVLLELEKRGALVPSGGLPKVKRNRKYSDHVGMDTANARGVQTGRRSEACKCRKRRDQGQEDTDEAEKAEEAQGRPSRFIGRERSGSGHRR